jgi:hypothetical protein
MATKASEQQVLGPVLAGETDRIATRRAELRALGASVPHKDNFQPRETYRYRPRIVAALLRLIDKLRHR